MNMFSIVLGEIPKKSTITSKVNLSAIRSGEGKTVVGVMPDIKLTFPDNLMTGTKKLRQIVFRLHSDGWLPEWQ